MLLAVYMKLSRTIAYEVHFFSSAHPSFSLLHSMKVACKVGNNFVAIRFIKHSTSFLYPANIIKKAIHTKVSAT